MKTDTTTNSETTGEVLRKKRENIGLSMILGLSAQLHPKLIESLEKNDYEKIFNANSYRFVLCQILI